MIVLSICGFFLYMLYTLVITFSNIEEANGTTIKPITQQEYIYTEKYKKKFLHDCYEYNSLSYCKNIYNSITEKK
jgi:hypothetical protein